MLGGDLSKRVITNSFQFNYVQYSMKISGVLGLMTLSEANNFTLEYVLQIAISTVLFGYV